LDWGEFSTTVKYGIGTTHERLTINGGQVLTAPNGAQTTSVGGLLALPSNIGRRSQNRFAQVPEAHVGLAVKLSRYLTIHGGYNIFFLSRVLRAADQIDRAIDITQIPNFPGAAGATPTGLGRPAALMRETGLLVHGLDVGLQFSW